MVNLQIVLEDLQSDLVNIESVLVNLLSDIEDLSLNFLILLFKFNYQHISLFKNSIWKSTVRFGKLWIDIGIGKPKIGIEKPITGIGKSGRFGNAVVSVIAEY